MRTTIVPRLSVPITRAVVCLDCERVFELGRACPACASESFVLLAQWLSAHAVAA